MGDRTPGREQRGHGLHRAASEGNQAWCNVPVAQGRAALGCGRRGRGGDIDGSAGLATGLEGRANKWGLEAVQES